MRGFGFLAAVIAMLSLGAVSARGQLMYSFTSGLDGFTPNGAVPHQSSNRAGSLQFVNSTGGFVGVLTAQGVPGPLGDTGINAITMDVAISAADPAFTGSFSDIGFGLYLGNLKEGEFGQLYVPPTSDFANIDLAPGAYSNLTIPITGDDPDTSLPASLSSLIAKGWIVQGFGILDSSNAAQTFYVDNVFAAAVYFWQPTSGENNWNTSSNWAGAIPNAIDAEADFSNSTDPNPKQSVDVPSPQTVGTLRFNGGSSFSLGGIGPITLQRSSGSGLIQVVSGVVTFSVPLKIASNTTFALLSAGASVTVSAPLVVSSGASLSASGPGKVSYTSSISLEPNAVITFSSLATPESLSLASGSTAIIAAHGAGAIDVLEVGTLSFGGTTNNWQGKLDINDNALIAHNPSVAAAKVELAQLMNQLQEGLAGGWDGNAGIVSSVAATHNNAAIGIELNDNGSGGAIVRTFDGQSVTNTDILVGYTYFGDTNLSGTVNSADYLALDNGFNSQGGDNPLSGWQNGDFNYDGVVNGDDYTLIDNAFNTQGSVSLTGVSAGPAEMVAGDTEQVASSVPEPGGLGLAIGSLVWITAKDAKKSKKIK